MWPVRYAHVSGAATQAPADAIDQLEHTDAVADKGRRNR